MLILQRRRNEIAAAVAAYDDANGFDQKRLAANLRRLAEAEFLSRTSRSGRVPDTYRLHLPPVRR